MPHGARRALRDTPWVPSLLLATWALAAQAMPDWQPVAADDLTMKDEPKAAGANAVILYREVERDDSMSYEDVYLRIKILKDAGLSYADVEIPYRKGYEGVRSIEARTLKPDGQIVAFNGKVYEKPIVDARGFRLMAKTFTLPAVTAGCIVEYRYHHDLRQGYVFDSHWILSHELFTRLGRFSLRPAEYFNLQYAWPHGLPDGTPAPPKMDRGHVHLEVHDVPAFTAEEMMPPENMMKYRVDFIYLYPEDTERDPKEFWKHFGRNRWKVFDNFTDQRRAMERAVGEIVAPGDSPEDKAHKIYARVQRLRNLSFEKQRTEDEEKHDNLKKASDVADVWKNGYGNAEQINWLFIALCRAAGLTADSVLVSTRDETFFDPRNQNPGELNDEVVVLRLGDHDVFVDPGTPLAPFGLLPWRETAVQGLRLDKKASDWVTTTVPHAADSHFDRVAKLALEGNSLEGTLQVTYTGLEALRRRLDNLNEDEQTRRTALEDEVKEIVPTGVDVHLVGEPAWSDGEVPLVAQFKLGIPGYGTAAGRRILLATGLFGARARHAFEHPVRKYPIYNQYPREQHDDVTITLPAGWQATSLPAAVQDDRHAVAYSSVVEMRDGALHLTRSLSFASLIVKADAYAAIADFYQKVRTTDEEQIVLQPGKPAAAK